MIGPKKLSTIREELRAAFRMSDKELLHWFNREIEELERQPKASKTGTQTLELLRDALLNEPKKTRRAKSKRGRSRSKT